MNEDVKRTEEENGMNNTINTILRFLSDDTAYMYLPPRLIELMMKNVKTQKEDIEKAMSEDGFENLQKDDKVIEDVKTSLMMLQTSIIMKPHHREFKDAVTSYLLLCFNWNQIFQDEDIETIARSANHLFDFQNSMVIASETLKLLAKDISALKEFMPPSIEFNKGYLRALDAKLAKRKANGADAGCTESF